MFEIVGKYNKAKIFSSYDVGEEVISQIYNFLNHIAFEGTNIAIMPDVHAGKGAVVGFTSTLSDKIIPNVIGVDIGCGVLAYQIGNPVKFSKELFETVDNYIRNEIPSGFGTYEFVYPHEGQDGVLNRFLPKWNTVDWSKDVNTTCLRTGQTISYVWNSLGTLGGGNHFIEINQDEKGKLWLVIHSGSRNFGLKIANYYQNLAFKNLSFVDKTKEIEKIKATKKGKEIQEAITALNRNNPKVPKDLAYLEGDDQADYLHDMNVAQIYAQINRRLICAKILSNCFYESYMDDYAVESVHNYIDLENKIIRKGAISAQKGERVLIPLNMAEGIVYGLGLGNPEWNYSAPHGAGRKMSRSKAKGEITLKEFEDKMKESGVMSSSVLPSTLDEAPQAYKDSKEILADIKDTVAIVRIMKPVYNFKAS